MNKLSSNLQNELYNMLMERYNLYISQFNAYEDYDKSKLVNINNSNLNKFHKNILKITGLNELFTHRNADNCNETDKGYYILKNRTRGSNVGYIIRGIDFDRHWQNYYNKPEDIDWDLKIDKVFWRGILSGKSELPGSRYKLMKNNFGKFRYVNIFLTKTHIKDGLINNEICKCNIDNRWWSEHISVKEFLKYKYILSVQGHDKDSGLNWKLNSNSVVLMNKPVYTSWLMESKLVPWIHYVPLNSNFTDLIEKIEWCRANDNKCKEIVKNANNFMKTFENKNIEERLEKLVIANYKKMFMLEKSKGKF